MPSDHIVCGFLKINLSECFVMVNAAQFGFVAPFIVELYFEGWNVRCTCALLNQHVYPCHESTSLEVTQSRGHHPSCH